MNLLSPRREVGEFRKRYKWMALAAVVAFGVLSFRIFQLQVIEYDEWLAVAQENITKTVTLPATRGLIRDTQGRIVATNRPSFNVYVIPQLLEPDEELPRLEELAGFDETSRRAFREKLERVPLRRRNQQVEMMTDIGRDQLAALETHAGELPGVDVVGFPLRTYPFGNLGAHVIGYLNEVSAEDLEKLKGQGYRMGDRIGRMGVEKAWEGYLRGRHGYLRVLVDARGRLQEATPDLKPARVMRKEPVPGRDLTLALDMELMRSLDRAFRGHPSGAAVVVEVHTGRIRAIYSKPSYDLNEMTARLSVPRYRALTDNPFRPLIDKAVFESYFPGSTFKTLTALAAIGDGIVDPNQRIDCPGSYTVGKRRFRCGHAHGEVDMRRALIQSCNVYFWKIAEQIGMDRLHRYALDFGFGKPTGIGVNSETSGFIPTREWYKKRHDNKFHVGFTLNTSIGQGNTRVTLLQLAMMYAAVANGGSLYVPQLVERVSAPDGTVIEEFEPRLRRKVKSSPEHLAYVAESLIGVVNDRDGTAYDARVPNGIALAGKTGTAQVSRRSPKPGEDPRRAWYFNRDHAWFAGFAPANDPEIAIVVLVEHGGAGGKNAAPIAVQAVQEYFSGRQTAALPDGRIETLARGGP